MSHYRLSAPLTGTGTVTVQVPETNTDRTLTLPDSDGALLLQEGLKTVNGSSLVGSGDVQAGKVLQVLNYTFSGPVVSSTTDTFDLGWNYTINKIKPDSRIVCFINFHWYVLQNPVSFFYINAFANGNAVTSSNGFGIWSHNPMQWTFREGAHQSDSLQFWDDTDSSSVTFTFAVQKYSADAALHFWQQQDRITFMEIEA